MIAGRDGVSLINLRFNSLATVRTWKGDRGSVAVEMKLPISVGSNAPDSVGIILGLFVLTAVRIFRELGYGALGRREVAVGIAPRDLFFFGLALIIVLAD